MSSDRQRPSGRWVGIAGATVVLLLSAVALAAPWLAPYDPIEHADPPAGRLLPPGSARYDLPLARGGRLLADRVTVTDAGVEIERLGEARRVPWGELALEAGTKPPIRRFLLGSDRYGRDLLSRLLWGARTSLGIGLAAGALALVLGLLVGGGAALAGGRVDSALMRLVDGLLAFPRLFLVIVLAALFGGSTWMLVAVLGTTGWMGVARLVRGEILSLKRREFVAAAEAIGQRPREILRRHLLPNSLAPVLVDAALRVGDLILVEAALSFLGLGARPPIPTWGGMIEQGSDLLETAWWVPVFPGVAIALTVLGFGLLADGLRDRLDPRRSG